MNAVGGNVGGGGSNSGKVGKTAMAIINAFRVRQMMVLKATECGGAEGLCFSSHYF